MKMNIPVLGLLLSFVFLTPFLAGAMEKKWSLALELGAGNICGMSFSRTLSKSLDIGIGAGFDSSREPIGDQSYSLYLLNGNISATYHIINKNKINFSGRMQWGYDALFVGKKFSANTLDLTPSLLGGYNNFYAIVSSAIVLTDQFSFVPSLGIGYCFQF